MIVRSVESLKKSGTRSARREKATVDANRAILTVLLCSIERAINGRREMGRQELPPEPCYSNSHRRPHRVCRRYVSPRRLAGISMSSVATQPAPQNEGPSGVNHGALKPSTTPHATRQGSPTSAAYQKNSLIGAQLKLRYAVLIHRRRIAISDLNSTGKNWSP